MIAYFLIALGATILGAMAGLGGGVIIKPLLDFLGDYSLSTIGVLSSFTVFSMAVVSIIKQIRYKVKIEVRKTVFIGIGSIIGGVLGDKVINLILKVVSESLVTIIQNSILAILLIFIYIYMNNKEKYKSYKVNNSIACILIGLLLGSIASFLSIGGGPINVCVLALFFSMDTKEAAVNSIITILFSQGSKLITIITTQGLSGFDLTMLPYMIIGGIVGGMIGSKLNKKFNSAAILKVFNIVVLALILLNVYNIISMIIW
ncbi:sulfite exporter TauE/SafE family protein [Clostridium sartagoforme]|uniref:Probable membrane transporter protein n=1 Tax=Clostridium sartagoforme TaxID=84031 RepID=A0A4S2DHA7_9CLOT|nr:MULTISPECIES: sulfite exporter TauE/SafE family protein [Clostridium]MBS5939850.1 sulfite exporter TauE/SafE family protein [Clostridium sp.]TGY40263.1 sulfite exporter TauE/SafE family protein [Clostridium sartagoforme]